ncbi:MAG: ABC transporter permease [Pseudodonghicola sp.]
MKELFRRYGRGPGAVVLSLVVIWIAMLIVLPNLHMIEQSFRPFLPAAEVGGPKDQYTINNYAIVFSGETVKDFWGLKVPVHLFVLLQTIVYSLVVTVACMLIAYPVGYALALVISPRNLPLFLLLLVMPLLVSDMLRVFAWYVILSFSGPLNWFIDLLGFEKVRWINGFNAITITLAYSCVLFMVIPIYNAVATLNRSIVEAAEDLGAKRWQIHRDIIIPHAKTGIASGCTMVFMFSVGSVITPNIMGSPDSRWFTQIIEQWMSRSYDWNAAAAYSFLLLLVCTIFVSITMRIFRVSLNQIAK